MIRLPSNLTDATRCALIAGRARAWRDEDLARARRTTGDARCRLIKDAQHWHRHAMGYLKLARNET